MIHQVNKTIFSNGLKTVTIKLPNVRSVSIGIWVQVGARHETIEENGLSHFIEHMLFRRTKNRVSLQLAREIDAIGGQANAFTSMEYTCYYARVADVHIGKMINILEDILLNYSFDHFGVEKERSVVLQEINSFKSNPKEVVEALLRGVLWNGNPLGRSVYGSCNNLMSFDEAELVGFFERFYVPDRILIAVAGAIEHQFLIDLLEPLFGSLKASYTVLPALDNHYFSDGSNVFVRDDTTLQAHICLGVRTPSILSSGRFAYYLMHTIIGGNASSNLFQQLRYNASLAYSVYSFILAYEDTGAFCVYAVVDPKDITNCVEIIRTVFSQIKLEEVSYYELKAAKDYMQANLLLSSDSTHSQMFRLAYNELYFGREISIQSEIEALDLVTGDDIMTVASCIFGNDSLSTVVLGSVPCE